MYFFEAPDPVATWPNVFLGGGITDCPDWQEQVIEELDERRVECVVVNPRRKNFPMGDNEEGKKQIEWEHRMLKRCDLRVFWFPAGESLCPITLFELGRWLDNEYPPVVGTEYGYKRAMDVRVQVQLEVGIHHPICKSLSEFTDEIAHQVMWWTRENK